ncbi:MAG: hypothetical protein AB7O48_14855 [Cyclobacteriaceae bacterium]
MRALSAFLANLLRILWTYRVITFSLLVMYAALWHADQGIDLLANLNADMAGPGIFISILAVLAAAFWHLPKFIYKANCGGKVSWRDVFFGTFNYQQVSDGDTRYQQESDVARLLGVFTFLIPACAILNALDKFEVDIWIDFFNPHYWLLLSAIAFGLIFHVNLIDNLYQQSAGWRNFFNTILILFPLLVVLFAGFNNYYPTDLGWLSADLFLLAIAFAVFVSIRRHLGLNRLTVLARWQKVEVAPMVMFTACAMAMVFIVLNFFPHLLAQSTNVLAQVSTVSVLLCGLLFYTLFFAWLILMGKNLNITIAGFFILAALIVAMMWENDFHDVRTIKATRNQRTMEQHITQWLEHRSEEIANWPKGKPYPVFIVNAYGGGIRASAWTSLAVASLEEMTTADGTRGFQHHVLAYSGASGGTIGASVLCAIRKSKQPLTPATLSAFYNHDFLSPVLIGMFGRDFFFSTFHIYSDRDRAVLQEEIWSHHIRQSLQASYDGPFSVIWEEDSDFEIPLLLANTYHVEEGYKGIAAPVTLAERDFPSVTLVRDLIPPGRDLHLSSAAFISARFPFISPAGHIENGTNTNFHFMDGGMKENAGAGTAAQVARVAETTLRDMQDTIYNKIEIHLLSLDNGVAVDSTASEARNLFELMAPLKALYTNWVGNTTAADELNKRNFGHRYHKIKLDTVNLAHRGTNYTPVYPLGWQLSEVALDAMKKSLRKNHNQHVMQTIGNLIVPQ